MNFLQDAQKRKKVLLISGGIVAVLLIMLLIVELVKKQRNKQNRLNASVTLDTPDEEMSKGFPLMTGSKTTDPDYVGALQMLVNQALLYTGYKIHTNSAVTVDSDWGDQTEAGMIVLYCLRQAPSASGTPGNYIFRDHMKVSNNRIVIPTEADYNYIARNTMLINNGVIVDLTDASGLDCFGKLTEPTISNASPQS